MHKTDISVAEEFELKDVAEEKDTSIEVVEFGEEAELKKMSLNLCLLLLKKNKVLVHEAEISVAEQLKLKDVAEEDMLQLSKEANLEKDVTEAVLVVTKEKDVLVH